MAYLYRGIRKSAEFKFELDVRTGRDQQSEKSSKLGFA